MQLVDEIIARLEAEIPELAHRCEGAADWAKLMRDKKLPQHTPAAHVIPTGISAKAEVGFVGQYDQAIVNGYAVLLTLRSLDATGMRALGTLEALFGKIMTAIAGWTPVAGGDVFRFAGLKLSAAVNDALVYQFDFTIPDTLRIPS